MFVAQFVQRGDGGILSCFGFLLTDWTHVCVYHWFLIINGWVWRPWTVISLSQPFVGLPISSRLETASHSKSAGKSMIKLSNDHSRQIYCIRKADFFSLVDLLHKVWILSEILNWSIVWATALVIAKMIAFLNKALATFYRLRIFIINTECTIHTC